MQHAAESIAYTLSKKLAVTQKKLKLFKQGAEYWLDADTQEHISKDMDFRGEGLAFSGMFTCHGSKQQP